MSIFDRLKILFLLFLLSVLLFFFKCIANSIEYLHISENFHSHAFIAGLFISYINLHKFESDNTVEYAILGTEQVVKRYSSTIPFTGIITAFLIWSFYPILPYPKFWLVLSVYLYYITVVISFIAVYYLQRVVKLEGKIS